MASDLLAMTNQLYEILIKTQWKSPAVSNVTNQNQSLISLLEPWLL